MTTPAMRHQARIRQQQAEAAAAKKLESQQADQINTLASDYEQHQLLLTSLEQDTQRLQGLSLDAKTAMKRDELVPRYQPVVDAYLAQCEDGAEPYKNAVLVQLMIWLFDLGEIQQALALAQIAVAQQQPMPERFNRNLHTYIADELRQWAEQQQANKDPIEPYFSATFERMRDHNWPVNKAALVKLHKVAGIDAESRGDLTAALTHYQTAQQLDPQKSKVKTAIAKLQKQLEKQAQAAADEQPSDN